MKIYAAVAIAAMLGLLGGLWYAATMGAPGDTFAACRGGQAAGGMGAVGGPFTLVSESGKTVSDDEVLTKPSLIYFGYTFCPDVCPFDAARNAEAVDLLAAEGYDVTPIFISVDPQRDTPDVLAEFTDYLHPDMVGLTGSDDQVKAASQAYKTYFARREGDDPEFYLLDHSVLTYLTVPEYGTVAFFGGSPGTQGGGVTAEEMATRAKCYLDAA